MVINKIKILMNDTNTNYISLSDAAKLTDYSQDYISLLCRKGKMKGEKLGRNWVTTREWVKDYINKTKEKGENVIPVKVKNDDLSKLKNKNRSQKEKLQICDKFCDNGKKTAVLPSSLKNESDQKFLLSFFRKTALAAFVVSIISIGFVIFENWTPSTNLMLAKAVEPYQIDKVFNGFISLSGINKLMNGLKVEINELWPQREFGMVAGVETSANVAKEENIDLDKNGLVIVPLEGDANSDRNRELIKNIESSFSDEVDIKPSENGISGVVTSKNNPEDSYLYLMVPVKE